MSEPPSPCRSCPPVPVLAALLNKVPVITQSNTARTGQNSGKQMLRFHPTVEAVSPSLSADACFCWLYLRVVDVQGQAL